MVSTLSVGSDSSSSDGRYRSGWAMGGMVGSVGSVGRIDRVSRVGRIDTVSSVGRIDRVSGVGGIGRVSRVGGIDRVSTCRWPYGQGLVQGRAQRSRPFAWRRRTKSRAQTAGERNATTILPLY